MNKTNYLKHNDKRVKKYSFHNSVINFVKRRIVQTKVDPHAKALILLLSLIASRPFNAVDKTLKAMHNIKNAIILRVYKFKID